MPVNFIKWLDGYLEEVVMVILLMCMVVIMCVQVCCRYFFNYSLSWSEELTRYLFIWASFISISYCVKKGISIKITQFEQLLPKKCRDLLDIFRNALLLCFALYMIPFAVRYLEQCINNGSTSASMGVPMYVVQSAPLVGLILLSFRLLQCLVFSIRTAQKGGSPL